MQRLSYGVCEIIWFQRVLEELKQRINMTIKLYCDNKSVITINHNPVQCNITKHIEIDKHLIKEKLEARLIYMSFVPPM